MSGLLAPGPGAGPARQVGQSPADKEALAELVKQRQASNDATQQALDQSQTLIDSHAKQVDALSAESKAGALSFQQQQKQDDELRAEIERHATERDSRARSELDRLEAQGVDPNHYWQSMGTAQKIGAAVAIGLGTFAAHPLGPRGAPSENTALGVIQSAVAADIDAQKANLQKSLQLAERRGQLEDKTFNRELAFANAQRDSHQTAYAVIDKDIARRLGLLQGSDEQKQQALRFQAAVREQGAAQVAADNKEIYAIRKAGERVVGGGASSLRDKIIAFADKLHTTSQGAVPLDQAIRQGVRLYTGQDIAPGMPEPPAWGKAAAGSKISARLVGRMADLNSAQESVANINRLLSRGSSLSPSDRASAEASAKELRDQGYAVPEHPLEVWSIAGARMAGLGTVAKQIATKKSTILTMGAGSGDSADELGLEEDR